MTTMVMLSHPTPPVSELDARQLSIMFSQIECSSCFAAIPLRTNSTTACEDWQSQMPSSMLARPLLRSSILHTVACNDEELVVFAKFVLRHVGERSDNLLLRGKIGALLELEIANGSAEGKVAIHATKVNESTRSADACLLALILRLVVKRERLRTALYAEDGSRVTSVALNVYQLDNPTCPHASKMIPNVHRRSFCW